MKDSSLKVFLAYFLEFEMLQQNYNGRKEQMTNIASAKPKKNLLVKICLWLYFTLASRHEFTLTNALFIPLPTCQTIDSGDTQLKGNVLVKNSNQIVLKKNIKIASITYKN